MKKQILGFILNWFLILTVPLWIWLVAYYQIFTDHERAKYMSGKQSLLGDII